MKEKTLAWAVHAYTALGLVTGILALRAVLSGDMRAAFLWLAVAVIIDATDGPLSRRLRCAEVLPQFSGGKLDDIVDYFNYVVVPVLILVRAQLLPAGSWGWAVIPLISSAYGFSRKDAKTSDGYFTGFPSYWNIVVFYLYYLRPSPEACLCIISIFALFVFIPLKYIDPFKTKPLRRLTVPLTLFWGASVLCTILLMPGHPPWLARIFLLYPYYYFTASFCLNLKRPK